MSSSPSSWLMKARACVCGHMTPATPTNGSEYSLLRFRFRLLSRICSRTVARLEIVHLQDFGSSTIRAQYGPSLIMHFEIIAIIIDSLLSKR